VGNLRVSVAASLVVVEIVLRFSSKTCERRYLEGSAVLVKKGEDSARQTAGRSLLVLLARVS
jgi:hypothetical protein